MKLNESLEYLDMEGKIRPLLSIDEFKSSIGNDNEIMVITFIVSGKDVGEDLVNWLERGYDFIIDAEISPGEVLDKKYYVFAELNRRTSAAHRIIEIIQDLKTLSGIDVNKWELKTMDGKKHRLTEENIKQFVPLTPNEYIRHADSELNEWREIANIKVHNSYEFDEDIKSMQRQAGIF